MPYESPLQKALRLQQEQQTALATQQKQEATEKALAEGKKPPLDLGTVADAKDRIAIIFDDSGSMRGQQLQDAKDGVIEFMRNCIPKQTACAIYPLNQETIRATTDLPLLSVAVTSLGDTGSTPLFETLKRALTSTDKFTRYIVFSDGEPNYNDKINHKDVCLELAKTAKVPVDTVLLATESNEEALKAYDEYKTLKEIADVTGGIFLVFRRGQVNFKTAFKYLAPSLRLMLTNETNKRALEAGKLR